MSADPIPNSTGSPPFLTVSVVSHGDGPRLPALLESLARYEDAARLQLIVTDNLGHDLPTIEPGRWHSLNMLHNSKPLGFASNHNAAFRMARGEYFCILNPDIVFVEPVFGILTAHIAAGQGDIAAPLVIDPQGLIQDSFRRLPTPLELFQRRALGQISAPIVAGSTPFSPDWIAGFFLLMRSSLYARLGGMDERYRLYMEDTEFCTRARLNGASLLVDPAVRLQHDARRASRQQLRYLLWHVQSAIRFFTSPAYWQARKVR